MYVAVYQRIDCHGKSAPLPLRVMPGPWLRLLPVKSRKMGLKCRI